MTPRRLLQRRVTLSFWAVVAVSFLVLGALSWALKTNRAAIRSNDVAIAAGKEATKNSLAALRVSNQARIVSEREGTATDLKICNELNRLKTAIRGLLVPSRDDLEKLIYYQEHPGEVDVAIARGLYAAEQKLPAAICLQLPSVRPPAVTPPTVIAPSKP